MIQIKNLQDCCGCSACAQGCPKQCIQMVQDKEGFLYPQINKNQCIDCGLCEKICPFLNQSTPNQAIKAFAAYNTDSQIRKNSSSGGIFSLFADWIIQQQGVVLGLHSMRNGILSMYILQDLKNYRNYKDPNTYKAI